MTEGLRWRNLNEQARISPRRHEEYEEYEEAGIENTSRRRPNMCTHPGKYSTTVFVLFVVNPWQLAINDSVMRGFRP